MKTMTPSTITEAQYLAWAKALESGKYTQGRNAFSTCDGDCCLAVLYKITTGASAMATCFQSTNCVRKIGMNEAEEVFYTRLNDRHRISFPEIAAVIRRETQRRFHE